MGKKNIFVVNFETDLLVITPEEWIGSNVILKAERA